MDEATRTELEAAAFRALVQHLRERTDVQNIDLMELAGFCRNCLSRWYREAAEERGMELEDAEAREIVYGMPYEEWKSRHQAPDPGRLRRAAALVAAVSLCGLAVAACGRDPQAQGDGKADTAAAEEVVLTPEAAREGRAKARDGEEPKRRTKAQVVQLEGVGADRPLDVSPTDDAPSPGAPTDAEVRAELRQARKLLASFKKHLNTTAFLQTGPRARVLGDGTAIAPDNAPDVVKRVIMAANEIAKFPYKWGGGHGAWRDNGYDCSGSVSFALAGAGLLGRPLTSGLFMNYGAAGQGRWITIYANSGHIFMVVAGLRFDTSGQGRAGTRWQADARSTAGFAVRHIPGL